MGKNNNKVVAMHILQLIKKTGFKPTPSVGIWRTKKPRNNSNDIENYNS